MSITIRIGLLTAWISLLVLTETCARPASAAAVPMTPVRVTATAYCLTGRTYSGVRVSHGIVAGGRFWSIGERLLIPDYGVGSIQDRGLLSHYQIDVWVSSCWYAIHIWGRREITVWRLGY